MSRRVRTRSSESSTAVVVEADGKVTAGCPRCGEQLRVAEDLLEEKIECPSCHRIFFPKTTLGQRTKRPDHSKTYMLFGAMAILIIGSFVAIANLGGSKKPAATPTVAEKPKMETRSSHPRAAKVLNWAKAIHNDNQLVFLTHTDLPSAARLFGVPAANKDEIARVAAKHQTTQLLRDMEVQRSILLSDESMTGPTGKALLTLAPRAGTDDFVATAQADIEVAFRLEGDDLKVTDWHVVKEPQRNPKKGAK